MILVGTGNLLPPLATPLIVAHPERRTSHSTSKTRNPGRSMSNPGLSLLHRLLFSTLACTVLDVGALADVILVDAAGAADADYTDLPPAFAAANHNDLILVRAGTYSSFSTDKGVRVLGVEEGVYVDGISTIHSLHFTKKFVMTNTRPDGLIVDACRGHVALESLHEQISWPYSKLTDLKITGSDDVRLRRCWIRGTMLGGSGWPWDEHWGDPAVEVINSEVEFVACNIYGAFDWDAENAAGGVGLFAGGSSRVRLSLTNVRGGDGSDGCNSWQRTEGVWERQGFTSRETQRWLLLVQDPS
jgi:hypothetical protein